METNHTHTVNNVTQFYAQREQAQMNTAGELTLLSKEFLDIKNSGRGLELRWTKRQPQRHTLCVMWLSMTSRPILERCGPLLIHVRWVTFKHHLDLFMLYDLFQWLTEELRGCAYYWQSSNSRLTLYHSYVPSNSSYKTEQQKKLVATVSDQRNTILGVWSCRFCSIYHRRKL